jgi:hypothetical protein
VTIFTGHVAAGAVARHAEQERLAGHRQLVAVRGVDRARAELPEAGLELDQQRLQVDQLLDLALVQEQDVHGAEALTSRAARAL